MSKFSTLRAVKTVKLSNKKKWVLLNIDEQICQVQMNLNLLI